MTPATRGAATIVPVIPVGPGERETLRLIRVVDSIVRCEPNLATLIVLVDGVTEAELARIVRPGHLDVIYLTNPRRGRGLHGPFDGLACGLTWAYQHIATHFPGCHAWKIDTDALVLRETSGQIADYFAAHPRVGMAGTYARNADGSDREIDIRPGRELARKFLRPVWYWRSTGRLTSPLFGLNRRAARLMRQAHAAGLPWGWHVQGGSYALSATILAHWLKMGRLNDPDQWLGYMMSEDVGFTHWTFIDGFQPGDFNGPGEAFAVQAIGMPMPVERLLAGNYGVVHSVKSKGWDAEVALAEELVRRTAALVVAKT